MWKLTDNNGETVGKFSTRAKAMAFVDRQRRFDPSYALWITSPAGISSRAL